MLGQSKIRGGSSRGRIASSELDASVQDLAHLYAAFARDRVDGGKTSRDFSDEREVPREARPSLTEASPKYCL